VGAALLKAVRETRSHVCIHSSFNAPRRKSFSMEIISGGWGPMGVEVWIAA
jgi:hypothetical protein